MSGLLARFPDLADLVTAGVCPPDRPGIVHRLDKGTSGLLAVARTEEAYRALVDQLATRTMERRYLALVVGDVVDDRGEVEAPIGRSTRTPTKMAVTASGKPARTAYTVRGAAQRGEADDPARTGTPEREDASDSRPHGCHRAPRGGDARYGVADKRLGSGRFFLHAFKLAFDHPVTGARTEFTSPLPEDLQAYLG